MIQSEPVPVTSLIGLSALENWVSPIYNFMLLGECKSACWKCGNYSRKSTRYFKFRWFLEVSCQRTHSTCSELNTAENSLYFKCYRLTLWIVSYCTIKTLIHILPYLHVGKANNQILNFHDTQTCAPKCFLRLTTQHSLVFHFRHNAPTRLTACDKLPVCFLNCTVWTQHLDVQHSDTGGLDLNTPT